MLRAVSQFQQRLGRGFLESAILNGLDRADLVAQVIRDLWPDEATRPTSFPARFFIELSSALVIAQWEAAGITKILPASLPKSAVVLQELEHAMSSRFEDYAPGEAEWSRRVTEVEAWLNMSRVFNELQAPVWLAGRLSPEVIDRLADFLWKYRQQPSSSDQAE